MTTGLPLTELFKWTKLKILSGKTYFRFPTIYNMQYVTHNKIYQPQEEARIYRGV